MHDYSVVARNLEAFAPDKGNFDPNGRYFPGLSALFLEKRADYLTVVTSFRCFFSEQKIGTVQSIPAVVI